MWTEGLGSVHYSTPDCSGAGSRITRITLSQAFRKRLLTELDGFT
jgi:hypothetical protein